MDSSAFQKEKQRSADELMDYICLLSLLMLDHLRIIVGFVVGSTNIG